MKIAAREWMDKANVLLLYELILKAFLSPGPNKHAVDDICEKKGFRFNWDDYSLEKD